ncbi:MAG: exonuclease domain-containing protein [Flavobacteriales bacterium]|jgi:DNA polymerase-3 subunit epsilon
MIYAVTDIETTGSHASGNSIIEIGIVLFDGEKVVHEFSTLIDPGVVVPPYISALTGITTDMLKGAPTFDAIADQLEEIFEGAIFVAHNVGFDFSFIRAEFAAIGRNWNPPRLCSMRMARKAFPGQASYGLNKICTWMGLTNEQAHRALSDARVSAEILKRSLPLVAPADFKKMLATKNGTVFLPPNLSEERFTRLPESTGVYYLYNEKGKPIYIGKAVNIKKRIRQHFTTHPESPRYQHFLREVVDIGYTLTGNELLALLLEDHEIRTHWPPYNSAQKRKTNRVSVIGYDDYQGYRRLAVQQGGKVAGGVKTFASVSKAREWLYAMAKEFSIDERLLGLSMFDDRKVLASAQEHNEILDNALSDYLRRDPTYIVVSRGPQPQEQAYLLVERGILKGYAFLSDDINHPDDLLFHLKPLQHTENTSSILEAFEQASWGYRRIQFESPNTAVI